MKVLKSNHHHIQNKLVCNLLSTFYSISSLYQCTRNRHNDHLFSPQQAHYSQDHYSQDYCYRLHWLDFHNLGNNWDRLQFCDPMSHKNRSLVDRRLLNPCKNDQHTTSKNIRQNWIFYNLGRSILNWRRFHLPNTLLRELRMIF